MKFPSQFSSENILMSVLGHLVMVAALITLSAAVIERARLVAPDRVEIIEIDLSNVKVSGDKTELFNTAADITPEPTDAPKPEPEQTRAVEPEPVVTEKPIVEPTMVEEPKEPVKPEPVEEKKSEKPVEPIPAAPKKRTVVRVNRETVGLNRTLTVSVVDALRVAMTRCWTIDTKHPGIGDIRAVAHLTMRKNGTVRDVWFEGATRADTDPGFAYVLQTIRSAINVCQPFRMLPANEFDKWEKIQLTFYPTQGKVM